MIFFDIDGTLTTEDNRHYLPETTPIALKKAQENGHLLFINTGRVNCFIDKQIRNMDFDGFVCGCGTTIYYKGEQLAHNALTKDLCKEIALLCRECNIFAVFEQDKRITIDGKLENDAAAKSLIGFFKAIKDDIYMDIEDACFLFDKIAVWTREDSDVDRFKLEINKYFDIIDRGSNMMEIVPKGYSKASGIKYLCEYFNITLDNCIAIGDSMNDLSMLEYTVHSVAMGNSDKQLFDKVEYITTDIEADGIMNALKHYRVI